MAGRQIVQHRADRPLLVLGLLIGEACCELVVEAGRHVQLGALAGRAAGGDLDQLARDLADPLLDLGLALLPAEAAQLVELDLAVGRAVARQRVQVLDRHEQPVAALIDQAQAIMRRAAQLQGHQTIEPADAVVGMDHEIALAHRRHLGDELVGAARPAGRPGQPVAQDVGLGEQRQFRRDEAVVEGEDRQRRAGLGIAPVPALEAPQAFLAMVGQNRAQALEGALARGRDHRLTTLLLLGLEMGDDRVEQVLVRPVALGREVARAPAAQRHQLGALASAVGLLEGREVDPHALGQEVAQALLADIERIRRQRPVDRRAHRARRIGRLAPALVMLADGRLAGLDRLVGQMVEAQRRRRIEIVGELHQLLVEQRQPVLHAGERPAVADRFQERIVGRGPEALQVAAAEALDRGIVQEHLADRQEVEPPDRPERALGQGVEGPDALQQVAEQIEPERLLGAGRVDVDDAAADRVFAGLHDRAAAPVAVMGEAAQQAVAIDPLAGRGAEQAAADDLGRRHLLQEGVDRRHDQARPVLGVAGQARQDVEPARHHVAVGRGAIVGQAVPGRQQRHLERGREEADQLDQLAGARAIDRDMQQLVPPASAGRLGQIERIQPVDRAGHQAAARGRAHSGRWPGQGIQGRFSHDWPQQVASRAMHAGGA